ncbi:MAG TPA: alpha/beta hydrolase [Acidimicrobiia bacterium]|nr:alpha/beta hydrolase [Acidimicrobiia bacterium]
MQGRRVGSVLAVAVVLVGLLGAGAAAAPPTKAPKPAPLHWRDCGHGIQCARLVVPLDDTVSHGPTISLALARLRASDPSHRIGSLVVNPGGPGASAVQYVTTAAATLPKAIRSRFDIVGFDPRGSGSSAPIVCTTRLDPFYNLDFTPHDDATRQALVAGVRSFVSQCEARAGAELPYVSTERTARDMERVRAALGDPRLTYLGYSYGTYLGALYADRYPHKVRAMVLDGAVDPTLSAAAGQIQQAQGFEHSLDLFLQGCSADNSCRFQRNGNAGSAYDALRARVETAPLPASGAGSGRVLNSTEFDIGVTQFLYFGKSAWSDLAKALDAADRGDGSLLLQSSDQYTMRNADGTYAADTDAFLAIGCLDGPDLGGLAGLRAIEDQAAAVAPRLGRSVVNNSLACAVWPVPTQTAPLPHADGAPPILVIGNTDDPATPLSGAKDLAQTLRSGVLLTVKSAQHTAYASGNSCVDDAVNRYLLQRVPPATGTQC